MNEDHDVLRAMLGESAARAPVVVAPIEATMRRGRALRTRRRAAGLAATVAALGVLGLGLGGVLGSSPSAHRSAVAPEQTRRPLPPPTVQPFVLAADQRVDTGFRHSMWLTADGYHFVSNAALTGSQYGEAVLDPRSHPGDVDLRVFQGPDSTLYTGAYRGAAPVGRVFVTVNGRTLEAQTLTLDGKPGWFAYYLEVPTAETRFPTSTRETPDGADVYTADGTFLTHTSLTDPTVNL
ncbi:hypothetical protein ACIRL2_07195 [Embleya sp. NPDC127516]|uniref:hypothetical protein n=1 Tax=Embleya sp. NPDC127516 TaxID=3363990 RepID=UPI00382CBDA6